MGALASVPSIFEVGSCFPPRVGSDGSVAGGTGSLLLWFGAEGGGSLRLGCGPSVWALAIPSVIAMVSAIVPMPANILSMVSPRCHSIWTTQRRTHRMVQFKKPIGSGLGTGGKRLVVFSARVLRTRHVETRYRQEHPGSA